MRPRMIRRFGPVAFGSLSVLALSAGWELAARLAPESFVLLSKPSAIIASLPVNYSGRFLDDCLITAEELLLGLAIGAVSGTAIAVLAAASAVARRAIQPAIIVLNSIPKVALAPLFILWFGFGLEGKVVLVWLVVFVIFALNMYSGITGVNPQWKAHLRIVGASKWQILHLVVLPASLPWLLTSFRLAVGNGIRAVVFAEFIGSSGGLGYLLVKHANQVDMNALYATLLAILAFAVFLESIVRVIESRAFAWREM